jgi:hypothetical protein
MEREGGAGMNEEEKLKQIIHSIRLWLILNVRNDIDVDLISDNKELLKAIREWRNEK